MGTPFLEPSYSNLGETIAVSFSTTPVEENAPWRFQKQTEGLPRIATTQKIGRSKPTWSSKLYGSDSSMKKRKLKKRRPLSKEARFLIFKRLMKCLAFCPKREILRGRGDENGKTSNFHVGVHQIVYFSIL